MTFKRGFSTTDGGGVKKQKSPTTVHDLESGGAFDFDVAWLLFGG